MKTHMENAMWRWRIRAMPLQTKKWQRYAGKTIWGCPAAAAAAKLLQSCPTLCDPIESSPPGSAVPGSLEARTLEWVAISFSIAWKWKVKVKSLSRDRLVASPWNAAHRAPPSMGFSRQEYWSGLPLPSPAVIITWILYSFFRTEFYFSTNPLNVSIT